MFFQNNSRDRTIAKEVKSIPILGAMLWGLFFSIFIDISSTGWTIIPILVFSIFLWQQIRCRNRYGLIIYWTQLGVVVIICIGAYFAPTKDLDLKVISFPQTNISLKEIVHHCYSNDCKLIKNYPIEKETIIVTLPSKKISMHKLLQVLEEQAEVKVKVYYCFHGANLLFGYHVDSIYLQRRVSE